MCGLYDVVPAKFGAGQRGLHAGVELRRRQVARVELLHRQRDDAVRRRESSSAPASTPGRIVEDNCFVVDSPQSLLNCRIVDAVQQPDTVEDSLESAVAGRLHRQRRLAESRRDPAAGDLRCAQRLIAPSLGRNLAACGTRLVCTATATVPLIAPMSQFEPRRTQIDLRLTKVFTLSGRARLRAESRSLQCAERRFGRQSE